jgi:hypothetical protein
MKRHACRVAASVLLLVAGGAFAQVPGFPGVPGAAPAPPAASPAESLAAKREAPAEAAA